jgi:hypothetical protein
MVTDVLTELSHVKSVTGTFLGNIIYKLINQLGGNVRLRTLSSMDVT